MKRAFPSTLALAEGRVAAIQLHAVEQFIIISYSSYAFVACLSQAALFNESFNTEKENERKWRREGRWKMISLFAGDMTYDLWLNEENKECMFIVLSFQ